jgi:carboxyl-terminal processing protease
MRKVLLWLLLVFAAAAQGAPPGSATLPATPLPELKSTPEQALAAHLAAAILTQHHYKALPLDSAMSEKIFDHYLKALDPRRVYFEQADIDRLAPDRTVLGDAILKEDLTVPFAIFSLYAQRVSQRLAYARSLLGKGFDFREEETYQIEREAEPWAKSEADMRELWRKEVKNDWLRLKLAGENDRQIAGILDKRYDNTLKRLGQVDSSDVFQMFMNAYASAIDPHTAYLGPRTAEEFDIEMKLSLVGVGATLEEKNGYTTIREISPGGPAALSGALKIGDRIVGIARGNAAMTDVHGWRVDDTVALIRGEAGSVVRLDVLPAGAGPDGKHKLVTLTLKKVGLEEQAARGTVLSIKNGATTRLIGVITLPGFYEDIEARQKGEADFKSATRDVMRLLNGFEKQEVEGVLIDLRNNGGGSLDEAVELSALFVGDGPVVQERDGDGHVVILASSAGTNVVWGGPIAVLINRGSASASEIFAAAIQDYGRGVVIGARSFGKGTVQAGINLDALAKNEKREFGELNMTIAQFFRVDGGTTQLRGVEPDIILPSITDAARSGESSFDNALPWLHIPAATYTAEGDLKPILPGVLERHDARVKDDKDYQNLLEDIAELKRLQEKNQVSLNEAERRKERDAQEARQLARETQRDAGLSGASSGGEKINRERAEIKNKANRDDGLLSEERTLASELAAEQADKGARDVILDEAAHILVNEVGLLKANARFVARAPMDFPAAAEQEKENK